MKVAARIVVLLSMIVQPTPETQITLSSTPCLRLACVGRSKIFSHTLQNKGPVPEDKQDYEANYPLVLRPNCYTVVIAMSGISDGDSKKLACEVKD